MKPLHIATAIGVPALAGLALFLAHGSQSSVYSQIPAPPPRLPNASIGAQVLGRVRISPELGVDLYGYFTYMDGINGPMFNGTPGENTALFTYRADPTAAELIRNGNIVQGLDKPTNGQFTPLHIYYNPNPSKRDFTDPNDFSQGQFIGRFRSRAAVVNVVAPGNFTSTAGLTLESASDFIYNGRTINFLSRANGLSLTLFGPAPSFESIAQQLLTSGYVYIPLSGTGYVAHSGN